MPKTNGSGQATTLSPEQLDLLLAAAPSPEQRFLWAVMRFTGSRVTETLRLTWGAIHSDRIVFVAASTKTRTTREPKIGPSLAAEAQRYRAHWVARHGREHRGRDLVFPGRFGLGEPMTRQAADLALRQTLAQLDLPSGISLHTFRRSLATTMAQAGTSLVTVARFTGHASLEQLRRYVDVDPRDEMAALAAIGG
jgi:integrase/recombinase XerD